MKKAKGSVTFEDASNRLDSLTSDLFWLSNFAETDDAIDRGKFWELRTQILAVLTFAFGKDHNVTVDFTRVVNNPTKADVSAGVGLVEGARMMIREGWFGSVKSLISGQIFSDFLEMAEYLLGEGYKDAAAVMIGSTLEEHLRVLCRNRNIALVDPQGRPRKADSINAELTKAQAYNLTDQKSVTAWLDLRNKAAHGHYNLFVPSQVELMLDGVKDFTSRVPA